MALTAVALALATVTAPLRACVATATGWLVLVVLTTEDYALREVAGRCLVFRPAGQVVALAALAVAVVVIVLRRDAVDGPGSV
jgi:hypothetical protein